MILETTAWSESGEVRWGLCKEGGGDMVATIDSSLPADEQEAICNRIAEAFSA